MDVWATDIAEYIAKELHGKNRKVVRPCSINNPCAGGLLFLKRHNENIWNVVSNYNDILLIVPPDLANGLNCTHIVSDNPRLDFARVVQRFFVSKKARTISESARIGTNVTMGQGVVIGEYSVIGDNAFIGENTEIRNHVVIADNTVIGRNCLIKSQTVIGEEGFGFERDINGAPVRIPHLGRVIIGNNVEIGASVVIARGTLDDTCIDSNVKIDDQVFIAHNVIVGKNTMVIANAEISGSSKIGANCWLGPNCSVMNGISIGNDCFIGLGTVVTKSLPDNVVAVGSPARILRNNR